MKYGATLQRRSPEWAHYNLQYSNLKQLIKHYTTPGGGTALSIPGQGAPTEGAFSETFFRELKAQHDQINLFVKSKSGEIEHRLDYISKQLAQFQARKPVRDSAALSAKTIERYAKMDNDIVKAGEEIRALSRFCAAQTTGFTKILKKYKRWTNDRALERRFKDDVASTPDSFYQLDFGHLLDQYIDVLGTLRAALETTGESSAQGQVYASSPASRLPTATENAAPEDFDLALSTTPLGSRGSRAVYWVHPDHVVEVEILLLQHMRVHANTATASRGRNAPPRLGSKNSTGAFGNEDDVGLVILDQAAAFAQHQNAATIHEETAGAVPDQAAGKAWWSSSDLATVAVALDAEHEKMQVAKVKRKHLEDFLKSSTPSRDLSPREPSDRDLEPLEDGSAAVRRWLADHRDIRPIASICCKRTRFVGLHNGFGGGLWATLDRDIIMRQSLPQDFGRNGARPEDLTGWCPFPHAVLEVRREGTQSAGLINMLDRSHLVERIRGFSLETHAVWTCCRPSAMLQPTWLPVLKQDIRKLPSPAARRPRRRTPTPGTGCSSNLSPHQTSTPATSITSPYPSHHESLSASEPIEPPSLRDFRKKRRMYAEESDALKPQRYWNEYDNHDSGDEGGYYIYIDPNASVKFPGQETMEAWVRKTRELFRFGRRDEVSPLLSATDVASSDDETLDTGSPGDYGTIASNKSQSHGLLSSLFRPAGGQNADVEARHTVRRDRLSLLGEIQAQQREREMTAFLLYTACLSAGAVLILILCILTNTSRKKLRGEVDDVVVFGVACNFLLLLVAITSVMSRKEYLGWFHRGTVAVASVAMLVADGLLLKWAL